jgi:hypothetical protein
MQLTRALTSIVLFLTLSPVQSNEVGNNNFVIEPRAQPVFISKGGTRMWPCDGMVKGNPPLFNGDRK